MVRDPPPFIHCSHLAGQRQCRLRVGQVISPNTLAASDRVADLRQRGVVLPAGEEGPEPVVEEGGLTACREQGQLQAHLPHGRSDVGQQGGKLEPGHRGQGGEGLG